MAIRRYFLLPAMAVVGAAVLGLSGAALAEPPPENPPADSGNPSCFGYTSRTFPGEPGPGAGVHTFTTLATGSHGTNQVDEAAREVGPVQHVRNEACPAHFPFPEQ